jgi:hypothetical protein
VEPRGGAGTGNDFTPNALIGATHNQDRFRTWQAKLHGTINLRWGLLIVPVVRHQSGTPFARTFVQRSTMGPRPSVPSRSRRIEPLTSRSLTCVQRKRFASRRCASWGFSMCTTCSTPMLHRRSPLLGVARGYGRLQSWDRGSSALVPGCSGRKWCSDQPVAEIVQCGEPLIFGFAFLRGPRAVPRLRASRFARGSRHESSPRSRVHCLASLGGLPLAGSSGPPTHRFREIAGSVSETSSCQNSWTARPESPDALNDGAHG